MHLKVQFCAGFPRDAPRKKPAPEGVLRRHDVVRSFLCGTIDSALRMYLRPHKNVQSLYLASLQ
jgi:hypothetical protein